MTLFQLLLFVHILAAMVWLGGALVGTLIGMLLRASGDAPAMGRFCTAFATVAGPAFGGSGLLVLLTGIGMVASEDYLEFSEPWISIGFAGWFVSMVLGATLVGGTWAKVGRQLTDGADLATVKPLADKAVLWTWVDLALRTVIVFVMVWRPT